MQNWMNLEQWTQNHAYQMSRSHKETSGTTVHSQGEFSLGPKMLPTLTPPNCTPEGSCFKFHTVANNALTVNTSFKKCGFSCSLSFTQNSCLFRVIYKVPSPFFKLWYEKWEVKTTGACSVS